VVIPQCGVGDSIAIAARSVEVLDATVYARQSDRPELAAIMNGDAPPGQKGVDFPPDRRVSTDTATRLGQQSGQGRNMLSPVDRGCLQPHQRFSRHHV
jgi:hypothetical protein